MSQKPIVSLISEIREILNAARATAVRQVNALAVLTNFEIGRRIVQHEQGGEERAEYGRTIVRALASELSAEFGRGFSAENLWLMRRFYMAFRERAQIVQTPSTQSSSSELSVPIGTTSTLSPITKKRVNPIAIGGNDHRVVPARVGPFGGRPGRTHPRPRSGTAASSPATA